MDSKYPQRPNIEEWSDQRCLQIAVQDQFPALVKDLHVQKHIISRYLNFYLGGKVPKGLSARDLTVAVIAIMPISPYHWGCHSEEFIWPESEYSENGTLFFLTPDDKLKYDLESVVKKRESERKGKDGENLNDEQFADGTHSGAELCMNIGDGDVTNDDSQAPEREAETFNMEKPEETMDQSEVDQDSDVPSNVRSDFKPTPVITTLKWYRLKRDVKPDNPTVETEYGPVENAKFCTMCNRILDDWESNKKERISLKIFFALTALLVMRSKAKNFQTLTKYFSTQFVNSFHYPGQLNHYTTPHRGFLKKSWKAFRETVHKNEIMFAKLVITSLLHPTRLDNYGKNNILKFAVLSHTAYFGMGIINMLQQLASYNNLDFEIIFASMYSDETAVSWNRVNEFFKKYLNEESKQHTFHWASIIESKIFKHLSCSNNYELAVVIAVFIEKITKNSGVWQSAWVSKGSHLENWKQLGYKLYSDYQKLKVKELMNLVLELELELF